MKRGGFIGDAVFAHRIRHHVERLAGGDQRVCECRLVIRVYVVVRGSINDQQMAAQFLRTRKSRAKRRDES